MKKLILILTLIQFGNSYSIELEMVDFVKLVSILKIEGSLPLVLVFDNKNNIVYKNSLYNSSKENSNSTIRKETIQSWLKKSSYFSYNFNLSDFKLFLKPLAKKEIIKLEKESFESKIIFISTWFNSMREKPDLKLKRDSRIKLFNKFQIENNNVRILNIDLTDNAK